MALDEDDDARALGASRGGGGRGTGLGMTHLSLEDDEEPRPQATPPPPHSVIGQLFERLGTLFGQWSCRIHCKRSTPLPRIRSRLSCREGTTRRRSSADGLIATIEMAEGKRTREDRIPSPSEQAGLVQQ